MMKKVVLGLCGLAFAVALMAPPKANAQVAVGIAIGHRPAYGYVAVAPPPPVAVYGAPYYYDPYAAGVYVDSGWYPGYYGYYGGGYGYRGYGYRDYGGRGWYGGHGGGYGYGGGHGYSGGHGGYAYGGGHGYSGGHGYGGGHGFSGGHGRR